MFNVINLITLWSERDYIKIATEITEPSNANFFLVDFSVVGVLWPTLGSSCGRPDTDIGFKREFSTESGMIMKNM
jgi:hypothetical protein